MSPGPLRLADFSGEVSLLSWSAAIILHQCGNEPQPASGNSSESSFCVHTLGRSKPRPHTVPKVRLHFSYYYTELCVIV